MKSENKQGYINWFLLSLFFAYQYILRVYPGVFTEEIRETFQISANTFSTLTTYALFIYSCLQIPFGLILDRFNVRYVILLSMFSCLLGQLLMSCSKKFLYAQIGRILIGIGSAPAFMSAAKVASDVFSTRICSILIGITYASGVAAVIFGNDCLKILQTSHNLSWQNLLILVFVMGLLLFFACLFLLKDMRQEKLSAQNTYNIGKRLWSVSTNYHIWIYGFIAVGTCSTVNALSDLWAPAFLKAKYALSSNVSLQHTHTIFWGLTAGSIILPWLFGKGTKVVHGLRMCSFLLIVLFILFSYGPRNLSQLSITSSMFALGFLACASVLCYSLAAKYSTPQTSALIVGWVNTMKMLGVSFLQGAIAFSLDYQWCGQLTSQGLRIYDAQDFEKALQILLWTTIICTLLACLPQKTKTTQ